MEDSSWKSWYSWVLSCNWINQWMFEEPANHIIDKNRSSVPNHSVSSNCHWGGSCWFCWLCSLLCGNRWILWISIRVLVLVLSSSNINLYRPYIHLRIFNIILIFIPFFLVLKIFSMEYNTWKATEKDKNVKKNMKRYQKAPNNFKLVSIVVIRNIVNIIVRS